MIGRLVGEVVSEEPQGLVLLDVAGVGYDLACPLGTVARAERRGQAVILYVHTHVREDALELFGFSSSDERATFRLLLGVPNVGPKLSLAVLHLLPSDELSRAIDAEDKVLLAKVPGVGKKMAERLVLELRGKLARPTAARPEQARALASPLVDRLARALVGLGYKPAEAERAATAVATPEAGDDLQALLRLALERLTP
jgi:Holliday junction DNA helicase RuvA